MKRLCNIIFVVILGLSLTGCQSMNSFLVDLNSEIQEANADSEAEEEENGDADMNSEGVGEEAEFEEFESDMTLNDNQNHDDNAFVSYQEDGVHVQFVGNNYYGNGYAFLPDVDILRGGAMYWSDGLEEGEEKAIVFYNNGEDIEVRDMADEEWENAITYLRDNSAVEQLSQNIQGIEGQEQEWQADFISLYEYQVGIPEEYDPSTTTMTTTYTDNMLTVQFHGNDDLYVLDDKDNVTSTLEGSFSFDGFLPIPASDGEIYAYDFHMHPEHNSVLVTIRVNDVYFVSAVFQPVGESSVGTEIESTKTTLEGYAVMTENSGLQMTAITYQAYEPLSIGGDFELPPTISTGDKIESTYDGSIMETYPAELSGVSNVKVIEEGDPSDVPEGILDIFREYGREVIE